MTAGKEVVLYGMQEVQIDKVIGSRKKVETNILVYRYLNKDFGKVKIPSRITSYINTMFDSLNSKTVNAKFIVHFLNYVTLQANENNEEFEDIMRNGIKSLNFTHAASYLRYCISELNNSYGTCLSKQKAILSFYHYLSEYEVIDTKVEKIEYVDKKGNKKIKYVNPFKTHLYRVNMPPKVGGTKKLRYMDENIYELFMKCCDEVMPELKLGFFLQARAGLRAGEVVNCLKSSIKINKGSSFSSVDVLDNQNILFGNNYNDTLKTSQVKRQRFNQPIIDLNEELEDIYMEHLKLMNKRRKSHTPAEALFINKDGYAMSGLEYRNKFNTLKRNFLKVLQTRSYSDYTRLSSLNWGSHIGRAIFTNFCIVEGLCCLSDGQPSAVILAKLRGDFSVDSAKVYIDEIMLSKLRIKKINSLVGSLQAALDGVKEVS